MITKREIWKVIPETNGFWQISNKGSIRKVIKQNRLLALHFIKSDIYAELSPDLAQVNYCNDEAVELPVLRYRYESKLEIRYLASLVYEVFHGISNLDIRNILYKDGNGLNFSLDNLVLCRREDFSSYFFRVSRARERTFMKGSLLSSGNNVLNSISRMVSLYNYNGNLLASFETAHAASIYTGLNSNQLTKELYGIKMGFIDGGILKYGRGPATLDLSNIQSGKHLFFRTKSAFNYYLIRKYNLDGKLVMIYNNVFEAAKFEKIEFEEFYHLLKQQKIRQYKGAIWIVESKNVFSIV